MLEIERIIIWGVTFPGLVVTNAIAGNNGGMVRNKWFDILKSKVRLFTDSI